MIIKKIFLKDYKILKDFSLELNKQISVFIGINGSGKSSILEALALMFSSAYEQLVTGRKSNLPQFVQGSSVEYLLRYERAKSSSSVSAAFDIDYVPIKLSFDASGKASISVHAPGKENEKLVSLFTNKYETKELLPSRQVIYYSGISEHFAKIYKSSENYLLKQLTTDPANTQTGYVSDVEMPMFLFSPTDFGLLFAGLWAFAYNNRIEPLLYVKLGLQPNPDELITVIINKVEFDSDEYRARMNSVKADLGADPDRFLDNPNLFREMTEAIEQERVSNFFGATGRLGIFLRQLRESCLNPAECYDEQDGIYRLNFSMQNWQALGEEEIQNPKRIFELLLMLRANGLLKEVEVKVIKKGMMVDGMNLSEGEKQIVIIAALNEILGQHNTLFLFDEPDNYLHPTLQDDLIRNIEENNNDVSEIYQNHYFVTTHNASLLNNLNSETGELLIIADGKLFKHHLSWFGRDANDTLYEIMGSKFRPRWAISEIQEVDELLDGDDMDKAEAALNELRKKLSGTDIEIIRLQAKLDFNQE